MCRRTPKDPLVVIEHRKFRLPLPDAEFAQTFDERLKEATQPLLDADAKKTANGREIANGKNNPPHHIPKKIG